MNIIKQEHKIIFILIVSICLGYGKYIEQFYISNKLKIDKTMIILFILFIFYIVYLKLNTTFIKDKISSNMRIKPVKLIKWSQEDKNNLINEMKKHPTWGNIVCKKQNSIGEGTEVDEKIVNCVIDKYEDYNISYKDMDDMINSTKIEDLHNFSSYNQKATSLCTKKYLNEINCNSNSTS